MHAKEVTAKPDVAPEAQISGSTQKTQNTKPATIEKVQLARGLLYHMFILVEESLTANCMMGS